MGRKTTDHEFIAKRLRILTSHSEELRSIGPPDLEDTDYGPMTALKLSFLVGAVELFSRIVNTDYDRSQYFDVLAGSGMTQLKDHDEAVVGSPILALTMSKEPFHRYHFFEQNEQRIKALKQRIEYLDEETEFEIPLDSCRFHQGDTNEQVPKTTKQITSHNRGVEGINCFSFVDNQGLDVKWSTVSDLTKFYGDIVVNVPSTRVSRDRGYPERHQKITDFFGTSTWKQCDDESEYCELYQKRLGHAGKGISKQIRINSRQQSKRYYYDLVWATRETPSGSPYAEAVDYLKERIETFDGDDVSHNLDVLRGDATSLNHFNMDDDQNRRLGDY